ncbi:3-deoxy-D-manno-octulosonic acid transferase [Candidatus Pelagibacter sp.]|nr:3-deoxy-D-manno-octulosonic acid transferase [Candidatus Pelagibacter sp.]
MLTIYRILINITLILSPLIIFFRLIKKKEDFKRFKEKFCFFSKKRKKGKVIWFHGASVGEIQSIIPLLEKFEKNKKIDQILITSNTLSSSKIISKINLKKVVHQFFPIDVKFISKKFLNYWNPSAAFFIDSEVWPNMILNLKKKRIPVVLINGRITRKSFVRWKFFNKFAKKIFGKFDLCFSSNTETLYFLKKLGAKKIVTVGNLKFSQSEKKFEEFNTNLKKFIKSKKVWCASSTHFNEEKLCGLVHKELKQRYKNLLTIIIPRHVNRTQSIKENLCNLGLKVHTHEPQSKILNNTDIYLVNAYGKTKSFYNYCKCVFLGGSIINRGGQNPLEAARFGCKILHGPNISNFKEIYKFLHNNKISNKITSSKMMSNTLIKLFLKNNNSNKVKGKINNIGQKILNVTYKEINLLLKNEI